MTDPTPAKMAGLYVEEHAPGESQDRYKKDRHKKRPTESQGTIRPVKTACRFEAASRGLFNFLEQKLKLSTEDCGVFFNTVTREASFIKSPIIDLSRTVTLIFSL